MVLQAYVDETGTDGDSPVFVFAGYAGKMLEMEKFGDGWRELLDLQPKVGYAKFSEATATPPRGAFYGLSRDAADEKLRLLSRYANRNTSFSFSVIVSTEDFTRASSAIERPKRMWTPYVMAFTAVMEVVRRHQLQCGTRERVEFIFDENKFYEQKIREAWRMYKESAGEDIAWMLGDLPRFSSDLAVPALQAADLLAGFIGQTWMEKNNSLNPRMLPWASEMEPVSDYSEVESDARLHTSLELLEDDWIEIFERTFGSLVFNDRNITVDLRQIPSSHLARIELNHLSENGGLAHLEKSHQRTRYVSLQSSAPDQFRIPFEKHP